MDGTVNLLFSNLCAVQCAVAQCSIFSGSCKSLWAPIVTTNRQLFIHPYFPDGLTKIIVNDFFFRPGSALAGGFCFFLAAGIYCSHHFGDRGALGFGLVEEHRGQAFQGIVAAAYSPWNLVNFATFFQVLFHLLLQLSADLAFGRDFVH